MSPRPSPARPGVPASVRALTAVLALAVGGCVILPQPPPRVAADRRWIAGATWGFVASPTRVKASARQAGSETLEQSVDGLSGFPLLDPRLSLAGPVAPGWEVGGHLSWITLGAEARHLLSPDPLRPLVLTVGGQTDGPLLWDTPDDVFPGVAWEARAGLSWQPRTGDHLAWLVGAGASFGPRRHGVVVPEGVLGESHGVDQQFVAELRILRTEVRAEGLLGVAVGPRLAPTASFAGFLIAAQPYVIVGHGDVTGSYCYSCAEDIVVESFTSRLGVALTVTMLLSGGRTP